MKDAIDMRVQYGAGPDGARCQDCVFLDGLTSAKRPGIHARNHEPIVLFRCRADESRSLWSVEYGACALFRRAS